MPNCNTGIYAKVGRISSALYKCQEGVTYSTGIRSYFSKEDIEYYVRNITEKYGTELKFLKSEDVGTEKFGGTLITILIAWKCDKKEYLNKYVEIEKKQEQERIVARKLAEKKSEEEKQKCCEAAKIARDNEILEINKIAPDINLLLQSATITLNRGPWVSYKPVLNLDNAIMFNECSDGIYVVRDSMSISFNQYRGTYYCGLTTFQKCGTKINILLTRSFYSGLTNIGYGKLNDFKELIQADINCKVIPYDIFMEQNKENIASFVEKHKEWLNKPCKQELIYSDN